MNQLDSGNLPSFFDQVQTCREELLIPATVKLVGPHRREPRLQTNNCLRTVRHKEGVFTYQLPRRNVIYS